MLSTVLTLMSFYLPPESGERISLVITNLLGIAVFMLIVAEILPPTSNEVSILSIFFTCCIIEVRVASTGSVLAVLLRKELTNRFCTCYNVVLGVEPIGSVLAVMLSYELKEQVLFLLYC